MIRALLLAVVLALVLPAAAQAASGSTGQAESYVERQARHQGREMVEATCVRRSARTFSCQAVGWWVTPTSATLGQRRLVVHVDARRRWSTIARGKIRDLPV